MIDEPCMLRHAIDNGVNYIDTVSCITGGQRSYVGRSLLGGYGKKGVARCARSAKSVRANARKGFLSAVGYL